MSKKPQKFKLWQNEAGKWCCSPLIAACRSYAVADTPSEAVAWAERMLADYRQMVQHFEGTCPEGCRWCRDHPRLKDVEKATVSD